jgi:uncharacterized protein with GYD domain
MPKYVLLFRAQEGGAMNMLAGGSEGAAAQRDAIKELGGTVEAQYAVTGHYDAVLIADFPNDASVLAASMGAEAGGLYVDALRAYSADEIDQARRMFPDLMQAPEASSDEPGGTAPTQAGT